jgi:hypothetical protein
MSNPKQKAYHIIPQKELFVMIQAKKSNTGLEFEVVTLCFRMRK